VPIGAARGRTVDRVEPQAAGAAPGPVERGVEAGRERTGALPTVGAGPCRISGWGGGRR